MLALPRCPIQCLVLSLLKRFEMCCLPLRQELLVVRPRVLQEWLAPSCSGLEPAPRHSCLPLGRFRACRWDANARATGQPSQTLGITQCVCIAAGYLVMPGLGGLAGWFWLWPLGVGRTARHSPVHGLFDLRFLLLVLLCLSYVLAYCPCASRHARNAPVLTLGSFTSTSHPLPCSAKLSAAPCGPPHASTALAESPARHAAPRAISLLQPLTPSPR